VLTQFLKRGGGVHDSGLVKSLVSGTKESLFPSRHLIKLEELSV